MQQKLQSPIYYTLLVTDRNGQSNMHTSSAFPNCQGIDAVVW